VAAPARGGRRHGGMDGGGGLGHGMSFRFEPNAWAQRSPYGAPSKSLVGQQRKLSLQYRPTGDSP
jgi:hypothetical protein